MAKPPKKQGPTAEERELNRVSVAQWNDYVTRFRPAEAELVRRAELTAGERASVKGQARGDVAAAFDGLTRDTIAAGGQTGARVNSGKTKLALAGNAQAEGKTAGLAAAAAETGAEIDRDQQQTGITGLGRSIATDVTADLSRGARRATNLALAASQARFQRNQDVINAAAAVTGAGIRKYQLSKEAKKKENPALGDSGLVFSETAVDPFDFKPQRGLA